MIPTAGLVRVQPCAIRTLSSSRRFVTGDTEMVAILSHVRVELKARTLPPLPLRETLIPKPASTKRKRLGIPTVIDRTVEESM
jgi:RNA-directed DNA polymerase